MKYTAIEKNNTAEIVAVQGCTTCPHKTEFEELGKKIMRCAHGTRSKKLLGNLAGGYHQSCPLPQNAKPFNP